MIAVSWPRVGAALLALACAAGMPQALAAPAMAKGARPTAPAASAAPHSGARLPGTQPCWLRGIDSAVHCGRLRRPLDPAKPTGPQIDIEYAVLPAVAHNKLPDPIFVLAGGPGQSAIDLAGTMQRLLSRLNNRRDIVLVDQRGTGRSAPLQCPSPPASSALGEMGAERQVQQLLDCLPRLAALPHVGRLENLGLFTTRIAMMDLDAVREALGAPTLNLFAASYGTRAALEYMRLFPQNLRRAVLDGVVPPDMALPAAAAQDSQAALDAVFAACAADAACASAYPQLRQRWAAWLQALPQTHERVRHPLTQRTERLVLQRDHLLGLVRAALYTPHAAAGLPHALHQGMQGQLEPLLGLASSLQGRSRQAPLYQGMHFSVVCAEDGPRLDAPAAAGTNDFGDTLAQLYRRVCAQWPRGAVSPAFYAMAPVRQAVLLLSGGDDPATPPRHGQRVATALGAMARHEVVAHAGHGVVSQACVRDALFRFVDAASDREALAVDTGCAREVPRPRPYVEPSWQEAAP